MSQPHNDLEIRSYRADFQVSHGGKVSGMAIMYETPTTIIERGRSFTELVKRDAANWGDDVKLLWAHDYSRVLGSTKAGTLEIRSTDKGLKFEGTLPESADYERESLALGNVDGMSFGFRVNKEGLRGEIRELQDITIREISIVAFAHTLLPILKPALPPTIII